MSILKSPWGIWNTQSNSVVTCKKDENQDYYYHVPKVQNGACNVCDLKFGKEVISAFIKR